MNAEARDGSGTYTAKGKTDGKLTLEASRKVNGKTETDSLALQMAEGGADYAYTRNKVLMLTGTLRWGPGELPARELPETGAAVEDVAAAMAGPLLSVLRQAAPDSWQQILHALSPEAWIDAQKEDE